METSSVMRMRAVNRRGDVFRKKGLSVLQESRRNCKNCREVRQANRAVRHFDVPSREEHGIQRRLQAVGGPPADRRLRIVSPPSQNAAHEIMEAGMKSPEQVTGQSPQSSASHDNKDISDRSSEQPAPEAPKNPLPALERAPAQVSTRSQRAANQQRSERSRGSAQRLDEVPLLA